MNKKNSREVFSIVLIEWNWLCILRARRRLEKLEKSGKALSSEEVCRENADLSRHCAKLMRIYDRI
jgi:hypothetical protein